jgi:hypothetical protein
MMMETALPRIGSTPVEMSAMTAAEPTYPTGEIQLLDSGRSYSQTISFFS